MYMPPRECPYTIVFCKKIYPRIILVSSFLFFVIKWGRSCSKPLVSFFWDCEIPVYPIVPEFPLDPFPKWGSPPASPYSISGSEFLFSKRGDYWIKGFELAWTWFCPNPKGTTFFFCENPVENFLFLTGFSCNWLKNCRSSSSSYGLFLLLK